jgi:LysM repeat protein
LTVGAAVAGVLTSTHAATAAPSGHDWSGVAQCESSGNWHINTGNGFFGGLQFTQSTWDAFGGQQFAARADLASESAQITVAEKVLAGQGVGAWPVCGKYLTGGSTPDAGAAAPSRPARSAPVVTTAESTPRGNGHTYTVRAGDTLAKIAQAHGVDGGWRTLAALNRSIVADPNLIYPGQTLRL